MTREDHTTRGTTWREGHDVRFGILGPLEVDGDRGPVEISGPRLRALLIVLLVDVGRVVTSERLIDDLWEADPPAGAVNALQSLVSRLRRGLVDVSEAHIASYPVGYRLVVEPDTVDAHRFGALAEHGRARLAAGDPAAAAGTLRAALDLWRGPALVDVAGYELAGTTITRLEELWRTCVTDRVEADLALGRHGELVAELESMVSADPLRERLRGQLMRALYGVGRQADALAVYADARHTLAEQLGADPSSELEKLHLAVLRHDPGLTPAAAERPAAWSVPKPVTGTSRRDPHTNLKAQLTSFVGRDGEVADLGELLGGARLVTLTGPGGAGKTRLASEVGARFAGDVERDVWFVALAPLRDPADVPLAVLSALGLREHSLVTAAGTMSLPPGDATDRLVGALGASGATIILDNCEHLVDAAAALADRLLADCPDLRVLATSREPLGITGERLWPVPPLGTPPVEATADAAGAYPSVRLLAERASSVCPGFTVDEANVAAVTRICRSLDGMPLAIELAAARLRTLPIGQVAERLDDRFRLLTSGSRTAMARHQTLRAVVEWSWELLTDAERILARRLSVFNGGATLRAAEQVGGGEGLAGADILDLLAALADKSLVELCPPSTDGELRYRMLETVRVYAAERLVEAGEHNAVHDAHAAYFLDLARAAEPRLRTAEQLQWLARLDTEHANILAALRWTVESGDAATALWLFMHMVWYWIVRGRGTDLRAWAHQVVDLAGASPPARLAEPYALAYFGLLDDVDGLDGMLHRAREVKRLRDTAVEPFGSPMFHLLDFIEPLFDRDIDAGLRHAEHLRENGDPWLAAMGGFFEATLLSNGGRMSESEEAFAAAVEQLREVGERAGLIQALCGSAETLSTRGAHAEALAALGEAVRVNAELSGSTDGHLGIRLALIRMRAGDLEGAQDELWRSREGEEADDVHLLGLFLTAELARRRGDRAGARGGIAELRTRLAALTVLGPEEMMRAMLTMSETWLAIDDGDPDTALRTGTEAVDQITGGWMFDMPTVAMIVECLAAATRLGGDTERAVVLLGAADAARGMSDLGDTQVGELIAAGRAELGAAGYAAAFARGRAMSVADLRAHLGLAPAVLPSADRSTAGARRPPGVDERSP